MIARAALRAGFLAVTSAALVVASASVALAANQDDGQDPGGGLSVIQTLLIFVGIPALLFVIIALLVMAPSMAHGPRYRPGLGWWAAPVWFNGPDDPDTAVRTATPTAGGGGASARW